GGVKVLGGRTGKDLLDLKGHTGTVKGVSFSPDGTRLASGSRGAFRQGEVKLWDARTGKEVLDLKGLSGEATSVEFRPDGARIATRAGFWNQAGEVMEWDAKTGKALLELKGLSHPVNSVAFSPDGARIIVGDRDKATVMDARTGKTVFELQRHTREGQGHRTGGDGVTSASFSPDGTRIVTVGGVGTSAQATVWEAKTGAALFDLTGHVGMVMSAAFSPDGTHVVTGGSTGLAKVWDARTRATRL